MKDTKQNTNQSRRKAAFLVAGEVILTAFFALSVIALFSAFWLSDVFPGLLLNELVFHLKAPLNGTDPEMVLYYLLKYGLPELLVISGAALLLFSSRKKERRLHRWHRLIAVGMAVLCFVGIGGTIIHMDQQFGLISYLRLQSQSDPFIEENYVDPKTVELRFPQQKRNLVYIYLESLEVTYADKKSGGDFDENYIPELTELALENECFNGGGGILNGGISLNGTEWTMGAIFGQSTGLPLKTTLQQNDMSTQESFFPGVTSLGDILEKEGYTNVFLLGSDVRFGGRQLFFSKHGDYRLLDYFFALDHSWIAPDYRVFWGYEDEKLFSFARTQLAELAQEERPFNLTLLTVDTHFEDGYVCRLCTDEFGDNQYANVIACSSRQVTDFIRWIQAQDFYENTTIVLAGDHPTMDSDFCSEMSPDYQRKVFFSIINGAPAQGERTEARSYSTFDLFPTTLAALGVQIPGDRLGLGANLYSKTDTLLERFGLPECSSRLSARSEFLDGLNHLMLTDELLTSISENTTVKAAEDEKGNVHISAFTEFDCRLIEGIDGLKLEYWDQSAPSSRHRYVTMKWSGNGYYTEITEKKIDFQNLVLAVHLFRTDKSSVRVYGVQYTDMILPYLDKLSQGDYLVFVAVSEDVAWCQFNSIDEHLGRLGASYHLQDYPYASYILVLDPSSKSGGPIYEAISREKGLQTAGEIDGITYEVKSSGFYYAYYASIIINGKEWAVNRKGFNIVVFDRSQNKVIDSVCFRNTVEHQAIRSD